MEWVKSVMIVFDAQMPPEVRGIHNGKYQAVELRLRSDGRCFFLGRHSKLPETVGQISYRRTHYATIHRG
jgi:hypothetical protein